MGRAGYVNAAAHTADPALATPLCTRILYMYVLRRAPATPHSYRVLVGLCPTLYLHCIFYGILSKEVARVGRRPTST